MRINSWVSHVHTRFVPLGPGGGKGVDTTLVKQAHGKMGGSNWLNPPFNKD